MAVYVDLAQFRLGPMVMCHMFSPVLAELHAMADRINMGREWYQDPITMKKISWPHYDIPQELRRMAVSFGAIECDRYQTVAMAAIVKWEICGIQEDPFRFFTRSLAHVRPRVAAWLTAQGYAYEPDGSPSSPSA